jgi:putative membrane protein
MLGMRARSRTPKEVKAMMFSSGESWAWWQMLLMWIGMIVFWALVIWGIWALVTAATRRPDNGRGDPSARQILDQRLARGEIDIEEYRRRREAIQPGSERTPVEAGANGRSTPSIPGPRN